MPSRGVGLVDPVGLAPRRHPDLLAPQRELADTSLKHERIYTVARRPYQHRGRPVKRVARHYLLAAAAQHVRDVVTVARLVPAHREDRPERTVDVSVGRTVERIEQQRV